MYDFVDGTAATGDGAFHWGTTQSQTESETQDAGNAGEEHNKDSSQASAEGTQAQEILSDAEEEKVHLLRVLTPQCTQNQETWIA